MSYGHEDEDAEIDRIAARDRDEDPRADLGYDAPRTVKPPPGVGHFVISWVPGDPSRPEEHGGTIGGGTCTDCRAPSPVLHGKGNDPRRLWCGDCVGRHNRDRVGWAKATEPAEKGRDR